MSYTTLILTQNHLQALLIVCSARLGNERDIVVGYPTVNIDGEICYDYMDLRGRGVSDNLPDDLVVEVAGIAALEVPPEGPIYDGFYWCPETGRTFGIINGCECSIRRTRFSISLADLEAFYPAWRIWA